MNGVATGKSRAARRQGTRTLRPMIEFMEDRVLLATFTVTNSADSGPGSLRQAILNANTAPGTGTIDFNIKVGASVRQLSPRPFPPRPTTRPAAANLNGSRPARTETSGSPNLLATRSGRSLPPAPSPSLLSPRPPASLPGSRLARTETSGSPNLLLLATRSGGSLPPAPSPSSLSPRPKASLPGSRPARTAISGSPN